MPARPRATDPERPPLHSDFAPAGGHHQPHVTFPRLSLSEWKNLVLVVGREVTKDQITLIAGSVAFSGLLAIFPVLIAIISVYGLLFDPVDVARQIHDLSATLPGSARTLLQEQMREIVSSSGQDLGFGLFVSMAAVLIAGSGGMHALIDGINLAYDQKETRNYFRVRLLAIALTLGVVLFTVLAVATIAILPHVLGFFGLGPLSSVLIRLGRWPALAAIVIVGLTMLYSWAPNRKLPVWRWMSFGAIFATVVWLVASLGFASYAANFGNYNKTYGTLAGVVVFMLWTYISAIAILVGAELNAELERRTGALARVTAHTDTAAHAAHKETQEDPQALAG